MILSSSVLIVLTVQGRDPVASGRVSELPILQDGQHPQLVKGIFRQVMQFSKFLPCLKN
jgi:hypothetical protein